MIERIRDDFVDESKKCNQKRKLMAKSLMAKVKSGRQCYQTGHKSSKNNWKRFKTYCLSNEGSRESCDHLVV